MNSFRHILQTKLDRTKPKNLKLDEKTIQFLFEKVIQNEYGIQGRSNVLPLTFHEGTLTLGVYKSLWQAEITLVKEGLRESLNQEIGSDLIQTIRIQRK